LFHRWSRQAATTAARRATYPVQTVSAWALSAPQQSTALSDRHRRYSFTFQCAAL